MKISKMLVSAVALMATNNYNNQVAASCESVCSSVLSGCILKCTATAPIPLFAAGCYSGCGIGYAACMAICAAAK